MSKLYFEDFAAGQVREFGRYEMTRERLLAYAREFDPQPFHLDEEAANKSMLGGLSASGWHTAAAMMKMNCDDMLKDSSSMGAPGIEELKWLKPVRVNDVLSVRHEVLGTRASKSRADMGLVHLRVHVLNQAKEPVMMQEFFGMMGTRGYETMEEPAARAASPTAKFAPPEPAKAPEPQDKQRGGFFEDLVIGSTLQLGTHHFTKEDIVRFAKDYDPQPFHVDEEAARKSHFGKLAASGWHTGAVWMRKLVDARQAMQQDQIARGIRQPQPGPSPGFRNLRWNRPVFAGDTLTYASKLIEKRETSRKGWGLIFSHNTGTNQDGIMVFEFTGSAFVQMRGEG